MIDISLDNKTGDLVFGETLRGAALSFVVSGPAVVQRVTIRLKSMLGEWFLDRTYGLPWFDSILVKQPDISLIVSLVRREMVKVPGVDKINYIDAQFDQAERTLVLTVDFESDSSRYNIPLNLQPIRRANP